MGEYRTVVLCHIERRVAAALAPLMDGCPAELKVLAGRYSSS